MEYVVTIGFKTRYYTVELERLTRIEGVEAGERALCLDYEAAASFDVKVD